jgi:hypothetical protein
MAFEGETSINGILCTLAENQPTTTLNITNITNASSQPVTARLMGLSFDADTKSYMTHITMVFD